MKRTAALVALLVVITGVPGGAPVRAGSGRPARIAFVRSGDTRAGYQIWTMRANASHKRRLTRGHIDANPAWSPDGRRIAFHRTGLEDDEIYVMTARGKDVTRLTDREGFDGYPAWSPDGEWIAYTHNVDARRKSRIFVMRSDGNEVSKLTGLKHSSFLPTWSPGGGRIAFVEPSSARAPARSGADRPCS